MCECEEGRRGRVGMVVNLNNVVLNALEWCLVGSILVPSILIEPCSTIKHTDKNGTLFD